MAVSTKEIKRRIKSVKNIGQITKAMELVSAAKMRKAQSQTTSSRPYAVLSSELLRSVVGKVDGSKHPLIERPFDENKKSQGKVLAVLISSDKGLAGALNANVISKAINMFKGEGLNKVDFITIGRKGADAVKKYGFNLLAHFPAKDRDISVFEAKPISSIAIQEFLNYTYDKAFVIYTDFVSTLVQKPNVIQILPLSTEKDENTLDVIFEPDPDEVLEHLIHRTIEFSIFQSMVEAVASEHSARMVAMKNANQAASDLIDDLTLSANQARQAGITRELAEISAAKLAMEG